MKQEILNMKAKTRDGQAFRDEEAAAKKTIARLEKKVQLSRIQLSVAHSENSEMRKNIDAMRLNKTMYLQIRNDMVRITCCICALHIHIGSRNTDGNAIFYRSRNLMKQKRKLWPVRRKMLH